MRLTNLIDTDVDIDISGVSADSRRVQKNYLFAALPGNKTKGTDYIGDAIMHGAKALIVPKEIDLTSYDLENIAVYESENPRLDFALACARFYKLQPRHICAVTGTSGKTSVVSFTQQLWHLSGIKSCASMGTLGVRGPGIMNKGALTTPDPQTLFAEIADLTAAGITHLAIEASSHGLDQYRIDGLKVSSAGFTNLSRDHLDYHKDMDEYFEAKARLFTELLPKDGKAVINADDPYGDKLIKICEEKGCAILTYGKKGQDITLHKSRAEPSGQEVTLSVHGEKYNVTLPLVGAFQVMNVMCALGFALAEGGKVPDLIPCLGELRGVPGRLELVRGHPKGAAVYVDYAHKPGALEDVLKTLRTHTKGRLVCLFGCGGDRDPGKRPMMGEIATRLADQVIVTDDNPRSENPEIIRQNILEGAPGALEIGDRAEAIAWAVKDLQDGDILVVAGKGHEQGQIVGGDVLPFDDVEEVQNAIGGMNG